MKSTITGTDTTFITNEGEKNLRDRFRVLIKDTQFFDVLVGYFYTSGFYALYKSLENTEKIRILIGISTNKKTFNLIQTARCDHRDRDRQKRRPDRRANRLCESTDRFPDCQAKDRIVLECIA